MRLSRFATVASLAAATAFAVGCGGAPAVAPATTVSQAAPETTQVFLLASGVGGDEPTAFSVDFSQIQLTTKAGAAATVLSAPGCANGNLPSGGCPGAEFMHVNGINSLPFYSARVPSGVYSGATVVPGACYIDTVGESGSGLEINFGEGNCGQTAGGGQPSADAAVISVPQPITLSSYPMALILSLDAPASYQISGCADIYGGNCTDNISPHFTLTAVPLLPNPDAPTVRGLNAQIESITGTTLRLQSEDGAAATVDTAPATVYSGVGGLAGLAAGMFIRFSGTVQINGTLLASRIEVDDSTAQIWDDGFTFSPVGPGPDGKTPMFGFAYVNSLGPSGAVDQADTEGFYLNSGTTFAIAGPASDLAGLPFTPTFNAQTLTGGQHVSVYYSAGPTVSGRPLATTVVLVPEIIPGVVTAVGSSGQDVMYTVQLSPEDLIPQVASLAGDFPHLADPATIYVYASPTTAMAAPDAVNADTPWRFRGLLFNDNGTLRMVCDAILPAAAPAGN
ncbi:MAG: DUF5666 domain-containing protein [Terriglobales bacterium]